METGSKWLSFCNSIKTQTELAWTIDNIDGPGKESLHFDDQSNQVVLNSFLVVESYKRNRKYVFERAVEITHRAAHAPTAFLVFPNFHSSFY